MNDRPKDSQRWCDHCRKYGDHHADRCDQVPDLMADLLRSLGADDPDRTN